MSEAENVVARDRVVAIEYTLTDEEGAVIDTSRGDRPLEYLHGHGQLIPGLERALEGKAVGAAVSLDVPPEDAYGERDPERTVTVGRDQFDFDVQVGDFVQAQHPDGTAVPFQVVEVSEESVTLDGNHPLAGRTLHFEVEVVAVRPATEEELEHGHVHE